MDILQTNQSIFIQQNLYVDATKLIRCEGYSNYTKMFFLDKRPILIAKTLAACALLLQSSNFVRVNRSHIINKNFVDQVYQNGFINLKDGSSFLISRRRKKVVTKQLA